MRKTANHKKQSECKIQLQYRHPEAWYFMCHSWSWPNTWSNLGRKTLMGRSGTPGISESNISGISSDTCNSELQISTTLSSQNSQFMCTTTAHTRGNTKKNTSLHSYLSWKNCQIKDFNHLSQTNLDLQQSNKTLNYVHNNWRDGNHYHTCLISSISDSTTTKTMLSNIF